MNENTVDQITSLSLSFLLITCYQHCSTSVQREIDEERFGKMSGGLTDLVLALIHAVAAPCHRRHGRHGGRCNHRPHSPLHHHNNRCLRPCHTAVCWRGPRPLPLTDRLTVGWSPRTPTPLHGVAGGGRVPSTVGVAPTELHQPKGPCHRAIKGGGGKRRRR
jgi:hypothetical protein